MLFDPVIAIVPFLVVVGLGLLLVFGVRGVRLLRGLARRRSWDQTPAVVTSLQMRRGRGAPANAGGGIKRVSRFETEDKWLIEYSYEVAGQAYSGASRCRTLPPPPEGRSIEVLVDPANPARSEFFDADSVAPRLIGYGLAVLIGAAVLARAIVALTRINP